MGINDILRQLNAVAGAPPMNAPQPVPITVYYITPEQLNALACFSEDTRQMIEVAAEILEKHEQRVYLGGGGDGMLNPEGLLRRRMLKWLEAHPANG